jgi:hypothetical protein
VTLLQDERRTRLGGLDVLHQVHKVHADALLALADGEVINELVVDIYLTTTELVRAPMTLAPT